MREFMSPCSYWILFDAGCAECRPRSHITSVKDCFFLCEVQHDIMLNSSEICLALSSEEGKKEGLRSCPCEANQN